MRFAKSRRAGTGAYADREIAECCGIHPATRCSHAPAGLNAPGTMAGADDKRLARLNAIKDMLTRLDYADKDHSLPRPDSAVVLG